MKLSEAIKHAGAQDEIDLVIENKAHGYKILMDHSGHLHTDFKEYDSVGIPYQEFMDDDSAASESWTVRKRYASIEEMRDAVGDDFYSTLYQDKRQLSEFVTKFIADKSDDEIRKMYKDAELGAIV